MLYETVGHAVADVIIEQAKKCRADLIVLGTHGRRGITRLVMSSDAEGVVRATRVPVLLVRHPKCDATKRRARQQIVVPHWSRACLKGPQGSEAGKRPWSRSSG